MVSLQTLMCFLHFQHGLVHGLTPSSSAQEPFVASGLHLGPHWSRKSPLTSRMSDSLRIADTRPSIWALRGQIMSRQRWTDFSSAWFHLYTLSVPTQLCFPQSFLLRITGVALPQALITSHLDHCNSPWPCTAFVIFPDPWGLHPAQFIVKLRPPQLPAHTGAFPSRTLAHTRTSENQTAAELNGVE